MSGKDIKLTPRPTFVTNDGRVLSFVRLDPDLYPTHSHRVVIDGAAKDMLSKGYRADAKSARFFLEKHER